MFISEPITMVRGLWCWLDRSESWLSWPLLVLEVQSAGLKSHDRRVGEKFPRRKLRYCYQSRSEWMLVRQDMRHVLDTFCLLLRSIYYSALCPRSLTCIKCIDGLPFPQASNCIWPVESSGRRLESRGRVKEGIYFTSPFPVRLLSEAEGHSSCQAILFTLLALYPGSATCFPCSWSGNTLRYCTIPFIFPTLSSHFCKWFLYLTVLKVLHLNVLYLSCLDPTDL